MKPYKPYNESIITLKLTRGEVLSLLVSLTSTKFNNPQAERWGILHSKIADVVKSFDEAHKEDLE